MLALEKKWGRVYPSSGSPPMEKTLPRYSHTDANGGRPDNIPKPAVILSPRAITALMSLHSENQISYFIPTRFSLCVSYLPWVVTGRHPDLESRRSCHTHRKQNQGVKRHIGVRACLDLGREWHGDGPRCCKRYGVE
jgi:hypothetical protein